MHADALKWQNPPATAPDPLWQHQLGLLLESTGEGIFGIDLAGHCTFINRVGARMLGWEPADVLGHNMHELTHHSHADGSHYPDTDCPIFNAFRRGLPCRIDDEVLWRADGSPFPAEYSSYPVIEHGEVRGAVVTFVDITGRKLAQRGLAEFNRDFETFLNQTTDFVYFKDADGRFRFCSQTLADITGWTKMSEAEKAACVARACERIKKWPPIRRPGAQ